MPDERSPVGGNFGEVTAALKTLQGEMAALRAEQARIRSAVERRPGGRAGVAEGARAEARARPVSEEQQANRALGDQNRLLGERNRLQADAARQESRGLGPQGRGGVLVGTQAKAERAQLQSEVAALRQAQGRPELNTLPRYIAQSRELSLVQASASQRQAKLNALHTEFLASLARGDSTLGEFRAQMGATIAKFAGWTAASAAVFGVLGAVRELGAGALDGLNAVNLLNRVIALTPAQADQAAAGLQNLSSSVNVPLKLAGDVAFRAAQSNKDLGGAFAVSRAALIAYKVDNIDAVDATLKLISIQQGLGISGQDVAGVFDQINQAQREFGVRVQYTLQGTAKASGAFRAAGGDVSHLIALLATGVRVSGRTGDQLGTALQRSAGFIARPINQKLLRQYGIDPTQDINTIYEDAIRKAPQLAGRQQLNLARALSSPQLAPYIVGILQHGDLYRKILEGTSPEKSRGSAGSELEIALRSPRQELEKFVNGLQRVGFSLAKLGAFQIFGVMLKAINGSVTALNSLLGLANELPEPFRKAGVLILEMIGLLKIARRFNVGAGLPAAVPGRGFLTDANATAKRQFLKGSREEVAQAEAEREATTSRLGRLGRQAEYAASARDQAARDTLTAQGRKDLPAEKAARERLRGAEARISAYNQDITTSLEEQRYQAERITSLKAGIATAEKTSARRLVRGLPGETPVAAPGGRPTTARPETVNEAVRRAGGQGVEPVPTAPVVGPAQAALAKEEQRAAAAASRLSADTTGVNRGMLSAARVWTGAQVVASKVPAAAGALRSGVVGAGGALRSAAARIGGLIGPFELFFIGLIAEQALMDSFSQRVAAANASSNRPGSIEGAHRELEATRNTIASQADTSTLSGAIGNITETLRDHALGLKDAATQAAQDQESLAIDLAAQSKNGILSGKGNGLLYANTIQDQVHEARRKLNAGQITLQQYEAALALALRDAKGINVNDKDRKKLTAEINAAKTPAVGTTLRQLFAGAADQNQKTLEAFAGIAGSGSETKSGRSAAAKAVSYGFGQLVTQLTGAAATPDDLKALADARDKALNAAIGSAKADLDRALALAHGQDERNRAYDAYAKAAVSNATGGLDQKIAEQKRRVGRDTSDYQLKSQLTSLQGQVGGPVAAALAKQAQEAKVKLGEDSTEYKALQKERKKLAAAVRDAVRKEVQEAKFTENQDIRNALAQVAAARVQDEPIQAGAVTLKAAHDTYMEDLKHYGAKDKHTLDALKGYIDAEHQQEQNVVDQIGEGFDIRIAANRDPLGKAQLGVQKIQTQLAHAKGSKRRQLLIQYYSALDALDQARLDIANSELDLAASRTDDPVELANIELRRAKQSLKSAHGQAARNKALADANTAKRNIANAKIKATEDELDYEVQIGQITTQQEVDGLKRLLKIKNLGKQARLDLLRKIGLLEHQSAQDLSSYELTVGNIKLPTVYEIRRAALQGLGDARAAQFTNNVRADIRIVVNDKAQAATVGQQLEEVLGTGRSDLRNLGTGGL